MATQTVKLSDRQAATLAAAILPDAIRAFVDANRAEYEAWLAERRLKQVDEAYKKLSNRPNPATFNA